MKTSASRFWNCGCRSPLSWALLASAGLLTALVSGFADGPKAGDVTLIENGQARAAIFVPERLLDDAGKNPEPASVWRSLRPEDNRRRLRESVKDLAAILQRITGAKVDIVPGKPGPDDRRLPILIGELATERFGKPQRSYPYQQGFRLVVSAKGIGLGGESDLASSYAIYTLLDQLGCRWYLPSAMGEVLPALKTLRLPEQDLATGPYTIYRGIWYCDNDYARRNRLGGLELAAGHALEMTVPKQLRKTNPEIRALIKGKPHDHLVKWTHPLVAQAIADACLARLAKDPDLRTFSLSPDDGATWDESDDAKLDAGDFDPAAGAISKTDRLMVLANRVAQIVCAKHPQVQLGILAYADYTRPPVREKVHPNVVPQIAPITFSRAHPMNDDGEPNNKALRGIVEGWARAVPATSYYFYGFYLAEVSSPNPMITKWGSDIPYIYRTGKCKYWQPETMSNFETSTHALYLGARLAWDPEQKPAAIIQELHEKFYGGAARDMAEYWRTIDDIWVKTPEYAGCGFGHLRRWTPDRLAQARKLLDRAAAACRTDVEKSRVRLASDSLAQFEQFMQLRRDLTEGRFGTLGKGVQAYRDRLIALGKEYQPQYAFARMPWTGDRTVNIRYFDAFYSATYTDAARVAAEFHILTEPPLRRWRYQVDKHKTGEAAGWGSARFDDTEWKTTDCVVDTWSALGLHNYMGSLWYRAQVAVPALPAGKKVYLWIGATDGRVKLFVNGKHVPHVNAKGEKLDAFTGYCQPVSFDITAAVAGGGDNQISLLCTRETLNELGTGGLLSPVVIYREKD
jgi:hypothetical protein